jgi:hypothetical protein
MRSEVVPYIRYPVLQIRPYGLLAYDRIEWISPRRHIPGDSPLKNLKDKKAYTGFMSPGARKRLRRAIQLIVAIAEPKKAMNFKLNKEFTFKLNFVTLTLPAAQGKITDAEIKTQVLDPWIKKAKRRFNLRSYIWRAERQGNGNLHFHLVTDTYLPYDQLRDTWNDNLNALGFIDQFEKKHKHRHPNSTDVHAIKKVKNLAGYFSKYMAKGERCAEDAYPQAPLRAKPAKPIIYRSSLKFKLLRTREECKINGRVWDCSTNLKIKGNCETLIECEAAEMLSKVSADPEVRQLSTEHCLLLFLNRQQFKKYVTGPNLERFQSWLAVIKRDPASDN